ncbi:MAG: penicillin-binding protein 2, partial [Calditrichaeota bacterium]
MKLVEACLGLAALILVARLVQIQIVEHEHYEWIANNQHTGDYLEKAKRGVILDRNGKPLALNQPCYEIAVHKRLVEDLAKTGERLARVLQRDKSEVLHALDKPSPFVVVGRRVPAEQAHTIQMMRLPGVTITEMSERIYPLNEKLAQVLGFVGIDGKGLSGVEYAFDRYLKGHDGLRVVQRDALGKKVMPVYAATEEEKDGDTLVLTIDRVVQVIAEEELDAAVAKYHAKGGSVVVLNPRSGEILAMASRPGFDANQAPKRAPNAWRIRPITDIFEPGSTFKIVTMMAALADSIKKPNDIVFCENGQYKLFGQTINDPEKHGWLSVRDVLKYSSNIGIAKIAQEVGKRRLFQAARSLGFGNKTGIDLPGEVSGILKNPTEWSRFSVAAIAYGHEVAVTPLQVAMAYAAVANGGKLMKPGIVKEIRTPEGERVFQFRPQKIRTVMNEKTAAVLRDILRQVVESGTGQMARVEGLDVAGKTGTAQKPLQDRPGYSDNKFVASFVGFFPAKQPRLLVFVDLDEPFPVHSGGHVAAPTFRKIVTRLMEVWSPPPV